MKAPAIAGLPLTLCSVRAEPIDELVVIVFANRSSDDFPIGEVWQGRRFAYDLLSAVACT